MWVNCELEILFHSKKQFRKVSTYIKNFNFPSIALNQNARKIQPIILTNSYLFSVDYHF